MFSTTIALQRMHIAHNIAGRNAADFGSRELFKHQEIANLLEQNRELEAKQKFVELELGTPRRSNRVERNWSRLVADYKAGIFQAISTYRVKEHQLPPPPNDRFVRNN